MTSAINVFAFSTLPMGLKICFSRNVFQIFSVIFDTQFLSNRARFEERVETEQGNPSLPVQEQYGISRHNDEILRIFVRIHGTTSNNS